MKFESGTDKHPALAPFLTGSRMQKPTGRLRNLKEATGNLKEILGERKAQWRSVRQEPSAEVSKTGAISSIWPLFYCYPWFLQNRVTSASHSLLGLEYIVCVLGVILIPKCLPCFSALGKAEAETSWNM